MACLASGFLVGGLRQEICYYQSGAGPAGPVKIKRRTFHSIYVDADDYIGKLKWVKSERAAEATLLVRRRRQRRSERGIVERSVVVPASWQFLDKLEATRRFGRRPDRCTTEPVEVLGSPELVAYHSRLSKTVHTLPLGATIQRHRNCRGWQTQV